MTTSKRRKSGLSKSVKITYGSSVGKTGTTHAFRLSGTAKRRQEKDKAYREFVAGMSLPDRQAYMAFEASAGQGLHGEDDDSGGWVDDEGPAVLPPGEEGVLLGHVGEDDLYKTIFLDDGPTRKRKDTRSRKGRVSARELEWRQQRDDLIRGYLAWKAGEAVEAHPESPSWSLLAINFFGHTERHFVAGGADMRINATLTRHGYLGTAPLQPSIAISFEVLNAYRALHRACPRLSVQALVRALCLLHAIPFKPYLCTQFRIAYDVYLDILYGVDDLVNAALGRDTPQWRMRNACAPCLYALEGEEELQPALLATMDGNQSLKHVDISYRPGSVRSDPRTARTDMWLSPEDVDRFKDEVRINEEPSALPLAQDSSEHATATHVSPNEDGDIAWLGLGDNDALVSPVSICEERWRNAGPESRKKMFALFSVTGVFVAICRHGQLLIMCDMIRSGELMKYPLAIVSKLIDVYGNDIKLGYDIACSFAKTLESSSLGDRARAARFSGVVAAFHGYSHNRGCQLDWHPLYMDGVGKEDFEGCERLFSESNALAAGTRLSTAFHRHQAIEEFFAFWSERKHEESGTFIHNNYRQALEIIRLDGEVVRVLSDELGAGPADYERYLVEERVYLQGLKSEPLHVTQRLDYMEVLLKLGDAAQKLEAAKADYFRVRHQIQNQQITQENSAILSVYAAAFKRWKALDEEATIHELGLRLAERWHPSSPSFAYMLGELDKRTYRRALDNLERLVVQRLFELSKLGMSGIGYKMREKIGKALKTRAEAIRKALTQYNRAAARLNPPRPALSPKEVMDMASLSEFDLLRDARQDVRQFSWAQQVNRKAMNAYFNVKRAREEIRRLNVESVRMFTSMIDEHQDYHVAISRTLITDPSLACELSARWIYRDRVNEKVAHRLYQTSQLPGFSGCLLYGRRRGRDMLNGVPLPSWAAWSNGKDILPLELHTFVDVESDSDDEDDTLVPGTDNTDHASRFVQFVDELGRDAGSTDAGFDE